MCGVTHVWPERETFAARLLLCSGLTSLLDWRCSRTPGDAEGVSCNGVRCRGGIVQRCLLYRSQQRCGVEPSARASSDCPTTILLPLLLPLLLLLLLLPPPPPPPLRRVNANSGSEGQGFTRTARQPGAPTRTEWSRATLALGSTYSHYRCTLPMGSNALLVTHGMQLGPSHAR